jgi:hypothetical protein
LQAARTGGSVQLDEFCRSGNLQLPVNAACEKCGLRRLFQKGLAVDPCDKQGSGSNAGLAVSNRWGEKHEARSSDDGSRVHHGLGRVRVSQEAIEFVRALAASPAGKTIPQSQRSVLRVLAFRHRLEVNCAWAPVPDIATESLMSERSVQRALTAMEKRGLILRYRAVRPNGSQTSNEYEFPGMRSMAVTAEMRQQVFTRARDRMPTQLGLCLGLEMVTEGELERDANGSQGSAVDCEQESTHNIATNEGLDGSVVGQDVCGNRREMSPPPVTTVVTPPGDSMVSPLEDSFEDSLKRTPPLPRLIDVECGKAKAPINASAEARATASARATATTSATVEMSFGAAGEGEAGMSSGRDLSGSFDGVEAALWIQAESVLRGCGIAPGSSTRRQRKAVMDALAWYAETMDVALNQAGEYACSQRRYYLNRAEGIVRKVDVRRFFSEGIWLQDWKSPRGNRRGGFDATVGMRRPN